MTISGLRSMAIALSFARRLPSLRQIVKMTHPELFSPQTHP
ncbi:hypothetical protein [Thermosynechococcus sp. HN-54]|nr:hypothetical protein [Thermosynechococcus sp. HN-54]